jgi:phytol kinase
VGERQEKTFVEAYLQIIFSALAVGYVIVVFFVAKYAYTLIKNRGFDESVVLYYNRKIVHMTTGGVIAFLVPFIFNSWIYPLATGFALALITILARIKGKSMDFMQTKENWNESTFIVMWSLSIAVLWILFNDPFLAVIPALFISFGDAITGIVRNALYKKRSKKPIGNIFMLIVCVVIAYYFASIAAKPIPLWGVLAAVTASIVERFEIGPIDDNILITVTAMIFLIMGNLII